MEYSIKINLVFSDYIKNVCIIGCLHDALQRRDAYILV